MDADELSQHISKRESAKLEFKVKWYGVDSTKDAEELHWGEFAKDILALTNGNIGTAAQTGYLIIGASDHLKPDGSRNLRDVGGEVPDRQLLFQKVNKYCSPDLPNIYCEVVKFEDKNLYVISIPPSPYLHILSKELKTPKSTFSAYTALVRRADGEETKAASLEEQEAIKREKQAWWISEHPVDYKQVESQGERQKLTLEVYDRKIEIYRTVRTFLGLIDSKASITIEELLQFSYNTNEALFLFDREVAAYIQNLYRKAARLYAVSMSLEGLYVPSGEEKSRLVEEKSEILMWFTEQFEIVRDIFYKYISL